MSLQIGGKSQAKRVAQHMKKSPYTPFSNSPILDTVVPDTLEPTLPVVAPELQEMQQLEDIGFTPPVVTQFNPYAQIEAEAVTPSSYNQNMVGNAGGDYLSNLAGVESSNRWDAHNKGSGAYGKYQFIPSTEKAYAKKLGLSIAEARTPAGQTAMVNALTADNERGLVKAGFAPTQENLYLAHQQGLGGALKMLRGGQASKRNLTSNGVNNYAEWQQKFAPRFR